MAIDLKNGTIQSIFNKVVRKANFIKLFQKGLHIGSKPESMDRLYTGRLTDSLAKVAF